MMSAFANGAVDESPSPPTGAAPRGAPEESSDRFSIHWQATYVEQETLGFNAPYSGANSLSAKSGRETVDITLFAGARLWSGAEVWINPEIDQGFGLDNTLGAAGFPSGEAYKVGKNKPYLRLQRLFVRQTIGLGTAREKIDAAANQLGGQRNSDRLVFTVGKLSVTDIFDVNQYAHDPRSDFLNWAALDAGSFDYAADAWGYTVGAASEWYQGPWTFRAGLFDLSIAPNETALDSRFEQIQWIGEIDRRYVLWDQPGKLAITGFLTRGRMGSFQDAIQMADLTGGPATVSYTHLRAHET